MIFSRTHLSNKTWIAGFADPMKTAHQSSVKWQQKEQISPAERGITKCLS
jgi:hypothetical protein